MFVLEQGNEELNRVIDVFDMTFRTEVLPSTYFRALHWASQQLIMSWEGFCVAVKALLPDVVHSTLQVRVCVQGRSSKTSSLGKVSTFVGYFGAPLMWFPNRQT